MFILLFSYFYVYSLVALVYREYSLVVLLFPILLYLPFHNTTTQQQQVLMRQLSSSSSPSFNIGTLLLFLPCIITCKLSYLLLSFGNSCASPSNSFLSFIIQLPYFRLCVPCNHYNTHSNIIIQRSMEPPVPNTRASSELERDSDPRLPGRRLPRESPPPNKHVP